MELTLNKISVDTLQNTDWKSNLNLPITHGMFQRYCWSSGYFAKTYNQNPV